MRRLFIENGEPDSGGLGIGPGNAVFLVSLEMEGIAAVEKDGCAVGIFDLSGAGENDDPFVFLLVVPRCGWRRVAMRNNSFDFYRIRLQKGFENFVRLVAWDVVKKIHSLALMG